MMLYLLLFDGWRQGMSKLTRGGVTKQSALVVFVVALFSVGVDRGGQ